MTHARLVGILALAATVAAPLSAYAQRGDRGRSRAGTVHRAVPRAAVRGVRPVVRTYRPFYGYGGYRIYGPFRPGIDLGFYYGYPGFGYGYPGWGWAGFGPAWPSYGYGGAYIVPGYRSYGGVRIDLPERDAEVYVDGYYAGIVDDFDGQFQQLSLEPGVHRIEIRAPGFESSSFEVRSEPGRTITYRAPLRPQP